MKSLETDIHLYSQPDLWTPDAEIVEEFKGMSPLDTAILLSRVVESFEWSYDANIYRAGCAEQEKAGNCLAIAELIMGICTAIGNSSFLLWNGEHARALMDDGVNLWDISDDKYAKWGTLWESKSSDKVTFLGHQSSGRDIIEMTGGKAIINTAKGSTYRLSWQSIDGDLGDVELVNSMYELMLPAHEAVKFISAWGDKKRYGITKPGLLQLIAPQIDRYLPKIINSVD